MRTFFDFVLHVGCRIDKIAYRHLQTFGLFVLLRLIGCTNISRVILALSGFFEYLSIDKMLRGMPMLND